ncbi:MAG: GNAT family N-acetyltransferase [Chloroflexi bacterium HGW-Chloroflexi-5]|jgi:ribosomal protein S18 acetylase RimI-like enzyme|nr:MAG: GNAT family N-acetyltransferase [Chloroflexi bacterium HGW-Chloroflexi-5]
MSKRILPLDSGDFEQVKEIIIKEWGSDYVIIHGDIIHPAELPGYKVMDDEKLVGLVTCLIKGQECEIVTLNSFREGEGIGDALIQVVESYALSHQCKTCKLVTTNDNLNALGFYQRRGFYISEVSPGAVDEARKVKISIPLAGENGISIHDEITLIKQIG